MSGSRLMETYWRVYYRGSGDHVQPRCGDTLGGWTGESITFY